MEEHKVNTKNIPAIVMLSAGAVASITMIATGVNTKRFLITLLIVLLIFYVAGSIIKVVLDKSFRVMDVQMMELDDDMSMINPEEGIDESYDYEDIGDDEQDSYIVEEREG